MVVGTLNFLQFCYTFQVKNSVRHGGAATLLGSNPLSTNTDTSCSQEGAARIEHIFNV